MHDDPLIDPHELAEANARCDAEMAEQGRRVTDRIKCAWKQPTSNGPLTDRKIERYREQGYYSAEFREARRQHWESKAKKQRKRDGNFTIDGGRLIYTPS